MNLLLKASEERESFYDLIGTEVHFINDIISHSSNILHEKGEKAFISDVQYRTGFWSNKTDQYYEPEINVFYINGISSTTWSKDAFVEFNK